MALKAVAPHLIACGFAKGTVTATVPAVMTGTIAKDQWTSAQVRDMRNLLEPLNMYQQINFPEADAS